MTRVAQSWCGVKHTPPSTRHSTVMSSKVVMALGYNGEVPEHARRQLLELEVAHIREVDSILNRKKSMSNECVACAFATTKTID